MALKDYNRHAILAKIKNAQRRKKTPQRRKRTLEKVTFDDVWDSESKSIKEKCWLFLGELADYIVSRYYYTADEKEDMRSVMILKGSDQIHSYVSKLGTNDEFKVHNWRNFIFTGMRNSASNYQYHAKKKLVSLSIGSQKENDEKPNERLLLEALEGFLRNAQSSETEESIKRKAEMAALIHKRMFGDTFGDAEKLAENSFFREETDWSWYLAEERLVARRIVKLVLWTN